MAFSEQTLRHLCLAYMRLMKEGNSTPKETGLTTIRELLASDESINGLRSNEDVMLDFPSIDWEYKKIAENNIYLPYAVVKKFMSESWLKEYIDRNSDFVLYYLMQPYDEYKLLAGRPKGKSV